MFTPVVWLLLTAVVHITNANFLGRIYVSEMFAKKIEPHMFNWTTGGLPEQYKYRVSLHGYPDLPSWMRYMYSEEYAAGYLYGTPPADVAGREVKIDIVSLNSRTYESKYLALSFFVESRNLSNSMNSVHMKIDNLNWVHLMDPGRVENLKNIFRLDLWPESKETLHVMFMDSAVSMGGRIPLRPHQKEGVIVYLGSTQPFSSRINELQEEIRPLYKLTTCTYKRTSVQTIFETAGFKIDWCAFRIVAGSSSSRSHHHQSNPVGKENHNEGGESISKHDLMKIVELKSSAIYELTERTDVPERNYIDELVFAFALPGILLALFIAVLSTILCFHFDNDDLPSSRPAIQMIQYSSDDNQSTKLRGLADPVLNLMNDSNSFLAQSPCYSPVRVEGSPHANCAASSTIRPQPPPYNKPPTNQQGNITI